MPKNGGSHSLTILCRLRRRKERSTNLKVRAEEWQKPFFNDFMPPSAAKGEEVMMYIHYCKYCRRIHILNGHKLYCPACSGKLSELNISYMKYVNLTREERHALKEKCADEKNPLRTMLHRFHMSGAAFTAKFSKKCHSAHPFRLASLYSRARRLSTEPLPLKGYKIPGCTYTQV